MLVFDLRAIGNNLLEYRKRAGLTQYEAAEAAGVSGRTYADIERGTVNMRVETLLRICEALRITPNDILTQDMPPCLEREAELREKLDACAPVERETALQLLDVYLRSLPR